LIIVAPQQAEAAELFRLGLNNAHRIKHQKPDSTAATGPACAAVFGRQNGSGSPIAKDEQSGSWLLAAGTWFHSLGLASGDEQQLLAQAMKTGAEKLADDLEGFFAIAFWNGRTRELFIITDIIGSRHCFVRQMGEAVAISTSSLLLASLGEFQLDPIGF